MFTSAIQKDHTITGENQISSSPAPLQTASLHASAPSSLFPSLNNHLHHNSLPLLPYHWNKLKSHAHCEGFVEVTHKEYNDLAQKNTFKHVHCNEVTTNADLMPLLWVFTYKFDTDSYLIKYKARLCVHGNLQVTSSETYTATLAAHTFQSLMAIAAVFNLEICQYDAVNVFINSTVDKDVFCECPDGFKQPGLVIQLQQALYSLCQSPLLWYNHLSATFSSLNLLPVPGVTCLFHNDVLLVFFHVDNIVVLAFKQHINNLQMFKSQLLHKYEIQVLGELGWFLGVHIVHK